MPARRTKHPFHSKCGRKARLFPREVFHPLAGRVRQHSEQFTSGYFFNSSLFSRSISFETTGIAHLKNQNKPFIFHTKTNWGVCLVMTQTTHITPCSQKHLGWEWNLALCLKRRTLSNSKIFEKCSGWTSAQLLRPKQSIVCWASVLQPSVWKRAATGWSVCHYIQLVLV